MNDLQRPEFQDETAARKWLEAQVWPNGPFCPHCGSDNVTRLKGKKHRPGLFQCKEKPCRKQFTVTVNTLFERSKIPLTKWLAALYLLSASKKGISTNQLSRMLHLPYKTAWFMTHRLREAMRDNPTGPLGGAGKIVEADETYYGRQKGVPRTGRQGPSNKLHIVSLVERGGAVRSFHVKSANLKAVQHILRTNVPRSTVLYTDESRLYQNVGKEYADHQTVRHADKEYVRGDVHTNSIEGYFGLFKRGMRGVYQHCGEQHLQRYLTEFDFRYSTRHTTDLERTAIAASAIAGKRLTYRRIGSR